LIKKINIVLIAYYFAPDRRVGALRASYWSRNLPLKLDCTLHVITANDAATGENIHFVPPTGKSLLSKFIKDQGLLWKKPLKSFFSNEFILQPDVVIITGGPFMHFGITAWLKQKYNCQVILDYRDPFAVNPGFKNNAFQILIKRYFERQFNKTADALVTVNSHCAKLVEQFESKKNAIIQNGFDETIAIDFASPNLGSRLKLIYTGKFYFAPDHLINALTNSNCSLDYYGADGKQLISGNVKDNGLVDYETALCAISKSDVGVIQTYGEDFQSTTKLFDYIRAERPILIISGNHLNRGSIHEELHGYPNVFWCKNDVESITHQLKIIQNHNYIKPVANFSQQFSRAKQLEKLIRLIQDGLSNF
jgi:hypothetical protein